MRYTPAGVAVLGLQLKHESEQVEGNVKRAVQLIMPAKALGSIASQLEQALTQHGLAKAVHFSGFLANKSVRQGLVSKSVVMHITAFQYLEN